ncbi:UDP-glycosyltransferase UGT5-like [Chrysoperla carnea]|uniref:UDP-glycosyltransferase UGT5-like n=1 Tax=Chrysoperla carnea TaxID=189513 RepID=UPI001D07D49E|nr:UDP-glycosyltransferase UGT5-like [Chrysoperla carnea]
MKLKFHCFYFYTILFLFSVNYCYSARILGVFSHPGRSHFNIFHAIMKELTYRGHSVDVIGHFPLNTTIERYKDFSLNGTIPILSFNVVTIMNLFSNIHYGMGYLFRQIGQNLCNKLLLESDVIENLLNTQDRYDLMITHIMSGDCLLILAHVLKIPAVIGVITSPTLAWSADRFGYPNTPSYIPDILLTYNGQRMSFVERLWNTFYYFHHKFNYDFSANNHAQKLFNQKFGANAPSIYDLQNNMSLLLVNGHFSLNGARPTPPNVIEVGGIHLKSPQNYNLPNSLEKVLNESKNDIIYFCLGSLIRAETFELDKQRALMETFRQLPYTVIWKGDRNLFNVSIPDNIIFMAWTPQQELLCHPNVKLFITHGGALGTQEAIYCGVPMIAIPLFYDQPSNAFTYQRLGIAQVIRYHEISTSKLLSTIQTVINNSSFKENVKLVSQLFQDRPQSAMDTAIYWIEYVIRYKGAKHLQPQSVELAWYQFYLIDVALVVIGASILICYIMFLAMKYIIFAIITKRFSRRCIKVKTG